MTATYQPATTNLDHLDEILRQSQAMSTTASTSTRRQFTQDFNWDSSSYMNNNATKSSSGDLYDSRKRSGQPFNAANPSFHWNSTFDLENYSGLAAPMTLPGPNTLDSNASPWSFTGANPESYNFSQQSNTAAGYLQQPIFSSEQNSNLSVGGYDDLIRPYEPHTKELRYPKTMYTASSSSSSNGSSPHSSPYIQSQSRYLPPSSPYNDRSPSAASSSSSRYSSPPFPNTSEYSEAVFETATDPSRPRDRRRIPCTVPGCIRRFTSQYTLKVHVQAHKPKPRLSFPCTAGCSEMFSRAHDRLRHEVSKHNHQCEWTCNDCGRFFSTSKTLGNHKCPAASGGTRWVS